MMQTAKSPEVRLVGAREAAEMGAVLVDVRAPGEHAALHIEGALLHPLGDLDPAEVAAAVRGKGGCVLVCASGVRARAAARKLLAAGTENVCVLDGGINAWEEAGLPLVRGESRVISVQRQMQLIIGSGIVAGVALGFQVDPRWFFLSAFFGAGLMIAGATGLCPLASLVARMPWNRRARPSAAACCKQANA